MRVPRDSAGSSLVLALEISEFGPHEAEMDDRFRFWRQAAVDIRAIVGPSKFTRIRLSF